MILIIISIILLTAIDQLSKWIALSSLKPIGNITIIENWFDLTFVENRGAAFGILEGQRWFFIIMVLLVTVIAFRFLYKMEKRDKAHNWLRFSIVLILSGAWGNVIDRIFRGYVVDYFEFTFIDYPVFNIADIYVVVGAILMSILVLFVIKDEDEDKEKNIETKNLEKD